MKIDCFYNEDSIVGLSRIPTNSIHSIISDIPYGINYDEWDVLHSNTNSGLGGSSLSQTKNKLFKRRGKPLNGWSEADKQRPLEYQNWVSSWSKEWFRVLKPGGSAFVFAGRKYSHRVIIALEEAGFTFKDMLSWERDKAPHRAQRLSKIYERRGDYENQKNWEGWRVANLRPLFEPILWLQKPYKTGGTIANNVLENGVGAWYEDALKKWNINQDMSNQSNMIKVEFQPDDRKYHTTQKPINLMKLLVELVTVEGQVILDPFAGSATTLLAAKELHRKYIGFEKDTKIFESGLSRL